METGTGKVNDSWSAGEMPPKAMELLSQFGPSHFVDAIQASKVKLAFRRHLDVKLENDDTFWEAVSNNLNSSARYREK